MRGDRSKVRFDSIWMMMTIIKTELVMSDAVTPKDQRGMKAQIHESDSYALRFLIVSDETRSSSKSKDCNRKVMSCR